MVGPASALQRGPGAMNLTAVPPSRRRRDAMVMITGQKGILSRKQGRFQVVDIVATMAPLTKMARQIVSPATIPTTVREAFGLRSRNDQGQCISSCRRTSLVKRCPKFRS